MAAASVVLFFFPWKGPASDLPAPPFFFAILFINCHYHVDFTSGAAGSLKTPGRGSVGMLVSTLADSRGLTQDDIEELSAILEKAKAEIPAMLNTQG